MASTLKHKQRSIRNYKARVHAFHEFVRSGYFYMMSRPSRDTMKK